MYKGKGSRREDRCCGPADWGKKNALGQNSPFSTLNFYFWPVIYCKTWRIRSCTGQRHSPCAKLANSALPYTRGDSPALHFYNLFPGGPSRLRLAMDSQTESVKKWNKKKPFSEATTLIATDLHRCCFLFPTLSLASTCRAIVVSRLGVKFADLQLGEGQRYCEGVEQVNFQQIVFKFGESRRFPRRTNDPPPPSISHAVCPPQPGTIRIHLATNQRLFPILPSAVSLSPVQQLLLLQFHFVFLFGRFFAKLRVAVDPRGLSAFSLHL